MRVRLWIGLAAAMLMLIPFSLFAQQSGVSEPQAADVGKDSAQQLLKEVSVSKFEDASFWSAAMPLDMGVVTLRRMEGVPKGDTPIEDEQKIGIKEDNKYVLGVKVAFYRRGATYFTISPVNPIPIEGITKTISVWAVGRNYNHVLKVMLEDYFGRHMELTLGKLNFMGWKKMTVAVPPDIVQSEYHFTYKSGLRVLGFRVEGDPMESYGTYYLYLDDLRAVTDLFAESYRDTDDMVDGW
jgi:hypothetical protein